MSGKDFQVNWSLQIPARGALELLEHRRVMRDKGMYAASFGCCGALLPLSGHIR